VSITRSARPNWFSRAWAMGSLLTVMFDILSNRGAIRAAVRLGHHLARLTL
jgi:hypothetical protein